MLKFIFFGHDEKLVEEYKKILEEIIPDSIFVCMDVKELYNTHKIDIIVSPANSFGYMNGGIDNVLRKMFPGIEARVKTLIRKLPEGFLPVGNSIVVPTEDTKIPYMIVAPTMIMPSYIRDVTCIYKTFYSILETLGTNNMVVACCGLGTGVGNVDPMVSATQIATAYKDYMSITKN